MDASIRGHSLAAESLGSGRRAGRAAAGCGAHLFAIDGDPLSEITAVRRCVLTMKGGRIYRSAVGSSP